MRIGHFAPLCSAASPATNAESKTHLKSFQAMQPPAAFPLTSDRRSPSGDRSLLSADQQAVSFDDSCNFCPDCRWNETTTASNLISPEESYCQICYLLDEAAAISASATAGSSLSAARPTSARFASQN